MLEFYINYEKLSHDINEVYLVDISITLYYYHPIIRYRFLCISFILHTRLHQLPLIITSTIMTIFRFVSSSLLHFVQSSTFNRTEVSVLLSSTLHVLHHWTLPISRMSIGNQPHWRTQTETTSLRLLLFYKELHGLPVRPFRQPNRLSLSGRLTSSRTRSGF